MNIRAAILRWLGYQPMDLNIVFPVKQLQLYRANPGCTAVLTFGGRLTDQEVVRIRAEWERAFKTKAVVLHGGLHLDSVVDSTAQEQKDKETT